MSFRITLTLFCFAVGIVMPQLSFAEKGKLEQSSSVTLSSLTQTIYERHPARLNELAQQQQINANMDLANAWFADVSIINLSHQSDAIGSNDGMQEWEGSVAMPLWLPRQKQQQSVFADTLSAELLAYQQQIKLAASAKVRELVWNVVVTNTYMTQAYHAWQAAQELVQDVTARVKAGELAATEHLLATNNALEMKHQYLLKNAEFDHALTSYRALTKERVFPQIVDELLSDKQEIDQTHPSIMLLDQQINMLRAKQELVHFDSKVNPSLSVGVRHDRGANDTRFNNSLGLGISFALDNDVYRRPAIAEASRALADKEIAREQLLRELNITLFSYLHNLESKRLERDLLNEQDKTTQEYLVIQQRAFELGELDLADLLRSQGLANEIHNRKLALEVDIQHTIALINQALGVIL